MPNRDQRRSHHRVRLVEVRGRKIQLRYRCPESGKEIRVSTGTYNSDEAAELKSEYEAKLRLGLPLNNNPAAQPHGPQMDWDLFRDKYRDLKLSRLRNRSYEAAESRLDICERIVKPKTLADMRNPETLTHLQNQLEDGVLSRRGKPRSKQTVRGYMTNVIAALNWAASMGWLESKVAFKKLKASTSDVMKGRPVTDDEFKLFRSKTEEVVGEVALESWLLVVDGLVESGLRISELMQVSWDLPNTIKPVWLEGKEPTLSFPALTQKNDKDQETPLLAGFEKLLLQIPADVRTGYVFNPMSLRIKKDGEPSLARPRAEWIGNVIGRIGKKSGIIVMPANARTGAPEKYISAHDLRRTCGQRLQDAGVPIAIISNVLRHGSPVTTRKYYIQGNVQNDAKMLKEIMGKEVRGDSESGA